MIKKLRKRGQYIAKIGSSFVLTFPTNNKDYVMLPSNSRGDYTFPMAWDKKRNIFTYSNEENKEISVSNLKSFISILSKKGEIPFLDKESVYYAYNDFGCMELNPILREFKKKNPNATKEERVNFFYDEIRKIVDIEVVFEDL